MELWAGVVLGAVLGWAVTFALLSALGRRGD